MPRIHSSTSTTVVVLLLALLVGVVVIVVVRQFAICWASQDTIILPSAAIKDRGLEFRGSPLFGAYSYAFLGL